MSKRRSSDAQPFHYRDTIAQCQEDVDEYIDELEADAAIAPESDVAQIQREAFDGEAD